MLVKNHSCHSKNMKIDGKFVTMDILLLFVEILNI